MHATYVTSILIAAAVEDLRFDRIPGRTTSDLPEPGSPCSFWQRQRASADHLVVGKVEIQFHVPIDMRSDF